MSKGTVFVTSQKEVFPCCVCGQDIKSYDMFFAIGCHTDCGGKHYWRDLGKEKPQINDTVLVFEQGYGIKGNYYYGYAVARYIKSPYDGRKKVFVKELHAEREAQPWVYTKVTHWMSLAMPEQIEKKGVSIIPN